MIACADPRPVVVKAKPFRLARDGPKDHRAPVPRALTIRPTAPAIRPGPLLASVSSFSAWTC
jgi:hypothetical protein